VRQYRKNIASTNQSTTRKITSVLKDFRSVTSAVDRIHHASPAANKVSKTGKRKNPASTIPPAKCELLNHLKAGGYIPSASSGDRLISRCVRYLRERHFFSPRLEFRLNSPAHSAVLPPSPKNQFPIFYLSSSDDRTANLIACSGRHRHTILRRHILLCLRTKQGRFSRVNNRANRRILLASEAVCGQESFSLHEVSREDRCA
jgi:hypothetical protein